MAILLAAGASSSLALGDKGRVRIYFGTFTKGAGTGIFMSELDLKTGSWERKHHFFSIPVFQG